ncbi:MAG: site-2 protease family protein [Nevskiales bacterium]
MQDLNTIQLIAVWALPVLFAITLHEVAHGWVARLYGDNTAAAQGRLSLNPIRHVDLVGTLLVPAILLVMQTGFVFGWAKPVPVMMNKLRNPRRNMATVAMAGPAANLVMASFWAVLMKIAIAGGGQGWMQGLLYMSAAGILINLVLMVLNLLPLPPLDGSRVLNGFVPEAVARKIDKVEPYGLVILILLLATGVLGKVLLPLLAISSTTLLAVFGISEVRFF